MMDVIQRYDEDFFNCFMGHMLSYLKQEGIPIELLFFKCMESNQRIYQSFIVHQRDRWHFRSHFFEFPLVGVELIREPKPSFEQAKPRMKELIDAGKAIFIIGNGFYIPHRLETYHIKNQDHNMIVTGYRDQDNGPQWFIEDHNRHPDFFDYYDEEIIRDFYEIADYLNAKNIFYFKKDTAHHLNKKRIIQEYIDYFDMYVDDFSILDKVVETINDHESDLSQVPGGLAAYERMFFFIASSRKLFKRFIVAMDFGNELEGQIEESIRLSSAIRSALLRGNVTKKLNLGMLEESCKELKEIESIILSTIQREISHQLNAV